MAPREGVEPSTSRLTGERYLPTELPRNRPVRESPYPASRERYSSVFSGPLVVPAYPADCTVPLLWCGRDAPLANGFEQLLVCGPDADELRALGLAVADVRQHFRSCSPKLGVLVSLRFQLCCRRRNLSGSVDLSELESSNLLVELLFQSLDARGEDAVVGALLFQLGQRVARFCGHGAAGDLELLCALGAIAQERFVLRGLGIGKAQVLQHRGEQRLDVHCLPVPEALEVFVRRV